MHDNLPVDEHSIEIAPGIFIPRNHLRELETAMNTDPRIAQAIEDMHTCCIEVAPKILVLRQDVPAWIERMEIDTTFCAAMDCLMDRLNGDGLSDTTVTLNLTPVAHEVLNRRRHSVASFAISYGIH